MIRSGRADVVLVGGTEACIHPITIAAFAAMRALSTRNDEPERASRPYDKGRDGFVMGEGAGMPRARVRRARRGPRRADLRRGRRRRHHRRRPPHRAARPRGHGRHPRDPAGARGRGACRRPTSCTSTRTRPRPRRATSPRPPRSARSSARAVDRRRRQRHQVDDRPPARRRRRRRVASPPSWRCTTGSRRSPRTSRTPTTRSASTSCSGEPRALRDGDIAVLNNSFGFGGHNVALVFRSA